MADRDVVVLTDVMLITCIVQKGVADDIVRACRDAGAQGATVYYARGTGVRERLGVLGVAVEVEKEVVNVVAATDQVDRIVEVMYLTGKLDVPGMGFLYVTRLEKAATHVPEGLLRKIRDGAHGGRDDVGREGGSEGGSPGARDGVREGSGPA